MYSFAQRSDTGVVDEPWYAAYLQRSGKIHPGQEEILNSQSQDANQVKTELLAYDQKPFLFVKNMAHHIVDLPIDWFTTHRNVFLIRDPHDLICSFAQVIPNPEMIDIGVEAEWQLFRRLKEKTGKPSVVLDSGELLKDPKKVMKELCDQLDLNFEEAMLSWPKGGRVEDGIWAKHWYKNVHNSTGFELQRKKKRVMPEHCKALYQEALPLYNELYELSIKA